MRENKRKPKRSQVRPRPGQSLKKNILTCDVEPLPAEQVFEGDGDVDDVVVVVVGDSDAVVVVDRRSEADRVQDVVFWLLNLVDFAETEQRSAEGPELNFGQIIPMESPHPLGVSTGPG